MRGDIPGQLLPMWGPAWTWRLSGQKPGPRGQRGAMLGLQAWVPSWEAQNPRPPGDGSEGLLSLKTLRPAEPGQDLELEPSSPTNPGVLSRSPLGIN